MHWFHKWGWLHRPISLIGWLLTALTAAAILWVFLAVDRGSHSASDTLIGLFPYATLFIILWNWVAGNTSLE